MRTLPSAIWPVRLTLLGLAFLAPALGFAVRSSATGNAEQAIGGLWPGFAGTLILLAGYAITYRTTAMGRAGHFGAAFAGILILWLTLMFLTNFRPL